METIYLRGDSFADPHALHETLKLLLDLPDHYGRNADALFDCLSERTQPVRLYVDTFGSTEVSLALHRIIRVVRDCGGEAVTQVEG